MATDIWKVSGTANWGTPSDWSTGSLPGQSDDVVIGSNSNATTVTFNSNVTSGTGIINTLKITPNNELIVDATQFSVTNGMPNGNFGTLEIVNGGFVAIDAGTVNNSGLIILKAPQAAGDTRLNFAFGPAGGTVTLNGAGMIVLDGGNDENHAASIQGSGVTSTLINDDNNISGTGFVGGLNVVNHGTFETNNLLLAGTMVIAGSAAGGSFENDNLVIADPNGVLILGEDGQTSKIINNGLIELKNSVQNIQSTIEIAGTLFLQNNQLQGVGSNIAGNVIVSDGSPPN